MSVPTQAVVLCGGLGTRLRPLTDSLPKPMAPVNGRPFLQYLLEQVREQGCTDVLLLTGYRGEQIREHFGDGHGMGLNIRYGHGPAEWETGTRLWNARAELAERFILLYSDNFAHCRLADMCALQERLDAVVSLLLQPKDRGNIGVAPDGRVLVYDPDRREPLPWVEVGYMAVNRDRLLAALDAEASLSVTLKRLAEDGMLCGVEGAGFYHSISDLDRLRLAERYLKVDRVLLIDRDGTINTRPPRAEYVTGWDRFHWVDSTREALRELAAAGFRFVVVSNQAGVARGILTMTQVEEINQRMRESLADDGVEITACYVCPHHWDDGCRCRKPAPGMFHRAAAEHAVRLDRTIYIGDDRRDSLAAWNAGCASILIGNDRHEAPDAPAPPDFTAEHLTGALPWILDRFRAWEAAN